MALLLREVKKATRSHAKKKTRVLKRGKDRIAGTLAAGMMLALVRSRTRRQDSPGIIAEHRGRIELVSGLSCAVFVLALPVAQPRGVTTGYVEVATNAA